MAHLIFSQDTETPIRWFDKFDKDSIKDAIVKHLQENPNDTVEHCKEYNARDIRRYMGCNIISFYKMNPTSKKVCKVVLRGNKEYLKALDY